MAVNIYREYKFKFYLNANHYIYIDGKAGQLHPHTWEFEICILRDQEQFVEFAYYEKAIEEYLSRFQNRIMNDVEPFDRIVPTLENIADYFAEELRNLVRGIGGEVVKLESSETPTRSYVIGFQDDIQFIRMMERNSKERMNEIIGSIVDEISG